MNITLIIVKHVSRLGGGMDRRILQCMQAEADFCVKLVRDLENHVKNIGRHDVVGSIGCLVELGIGRW